MKKIVLYIIGIVLFCFVIPIMFTEQFAFNNIIAEKDNNAEKKENGKEKEKEEIKKSVIPINEKINVLFTNEEAVKEINLEEYLYGVVSAEMPASFELEALKAQAVVARTYTLYKIENNYNKHENAVICTNSNCCQAWISKEARLERWEEEEKEGYWNKIVTAVDSTKGEIIVYDGKVINAFFHANSGGKTELPVNVWGGSEYPYLQTVETSGEDEYSQYLSEVEFTRNELIQALQKSYPGIELELDEIEIIERYESGRIKSIKFGNHSMAGVEARSLLGLKSANFDLELKEDKIKFTVYGYGHGVGMSQTGADSLAKKGYNYIEIIKHFYKDTDVQFLEY